MSCLCPLYCSPDIVLRPYPQIDQLEVAHDQEVYELKRSIDNANEKFANLESSQRHVISDLERELEKVKEELRCVAHCHSAFSSII